MAPPLVWIDLETTGLDPRSDRILEVGLAATDDNLDPIPGIDPYQTVIYQEDFDVRKYDAAVIEMHANSGLLTEIAAGRGARRDQAEHRMRIWLHNLSNRYLDPENAGFLMAGSTVGQFDRQFFSRAWPKLMEPFHYRVLDVSSIKELVRRLYGDDAVYSAEDAARDDIVVKAHRVLPDIEASIAELRFYVNSYFAGRP